MQRHRIFGSGKSTSRPDSSILRRPSPVADRFLCPLLRLPPRFQDQPEQFEFSQFRRDLVSLCLLLMRCESGWWWDRKYRPSLISATIWLFLISGRRSKQYYSITVYIWYLLSRLTSQMISRSILLAEIPRPAHGPDEVASYPHRLRSALTIVFFFARAREPRRRRGR